MVVFSHLAFLSNSQSGLLSHLYNAIFCEGYIGVTFFFILSGFILSYTYAEKIKSGAVNYKQFLIARISRIYPLHIFTFLISIPLVIAGMFARNDFNFMPLFPNLILAQSFFSDATVYLSGNSPSWSLSNEMFFYLLFPLFIFCKKYILAVLCFFTLIFHLYVPYSALSLEDKYFYTYIFPPSRLADFLVGIILYRVFFYIDMNRCRFNVNMMQCLSIILLIFFVSVKNFIDQYWRYDIYYVLPMAFIVFSFSFSGGALAKILSNRTLVALGEASFSLYLIHQLVIRYVTGIGNKIIGFHGVIWDCSSSLFIIFASIGISVMIYKYFEIKAKGFTHKILSDFLFKKFD